MPDPSISSDAVFAYCRLSRECLRGPGSTEEKFEVRRQICRNLAAQHNLPLDDSHILCERASGTKLSTRPDMVALLDRVRAGTVAYIISPNQQRLLRGDKRDEQEIEDALLGARVTVVTSDGIMPFDENYHVTHALVFDVQSAVARNYVARGIKDRKEADYVRLKRGQRTHGRAPYGYTYLRPTFDATGHQLTSQQHIVSAEEYEIVKEVFQRIWRESMRSIALDLTARGVVAPGGGAVWQQSKIASMVSNPFYAGYLSQRIKYDRSKGRVRMGKEEYILSDVAGDWPAPITLSEWYQLQSLLSERSGPLAPRTALLTGVLFGVCGNGMVRNGAGNKYVCSCHTQRPHHANLNVPAPKVEAWARQIVDAVLDHLPASAFDDLQSSEKTIDRAALERAFRQARKTHDERDSELRRFARETASLARRLSTSDIDAILSEIIKERDGAKATMDHLQRQLAAPQLVTLAPIIKRIQQVDRARFWEEANTQEQRGILRDFVARLDLLPPAEGKRQITDGKITLWEWLHPYNIPLPPFPVRKSSR